MSERDYDKNVYILGAGFSAPAKAPLLNDFLSVSNDLSYNPRSDLTDKERDIFRSVFKHKGDLSLSRERINIDLDNIEELFGLVEMECEIGDTSRIEEIAKIRDNLTYMIVKTLDLRIKRGPGVRIIGVTDRLKEFKSAFGKLNYNREFSIYEYFILLASRKWESVNKESKCSSDTIITFNYDLIADNAIRECGMKPNYGINGEMPANNEFHMNLLKLHGSANWKYCAKPSCNWIGVEYGTSKVDLSKISAEKCPECKSKNISTLIVPPTWNKAKYQGSIKKVWEKAVEELKKARRIIVIGYSMPETDTFFKYLLTVALSENRVLDKIVIVNKGEELRARYARFIDSFFIEHGKFVFADTYFEEFTRNRDWRELINRNYFNTTNDLRWQSFTRTTSSTSL